MREYAEGVCEGKIRAGKWVRLACHRHLLDCQHGHARGLVWDLDAALHAIEFFGFLCHSKGAWAGNKFDLELWQKFIIGSVFGWYRSNGTRRYRYSYAEIPRKAGKTTIAAGTGLYLLVADGEAGAEIYSAASKRDQARLSHSEAKSMVRSSPPLASRIRIFKDNLYFGESNSKFEPLGADADTLDGLNPSGLILDEMHAWKNRDLWDVLDTARGARSQPLTFSITTAGVSRESICREQHDHVESILNNHIENDAYFGYISTIDDEDDWLDPAAWYKAQPNLGVSILEEYYREQLSKAKYSVAESAAAKRLYLNIWTQSMHGWLDMTRWMQCGEAFDETGLRGVRCFGGLDLANTSDIAAFVLVFPVDDLFYIIPRFWIPKEAHSQYSKRLREILRPWVARGFIEETEGDTIDIELIEERIVALTKEHNVAEIAFDEWNAASTAQRLTKIGLKMTKFLQNIRSYNEGSKFLEQIVLENRLRHGGNPVMRWMASNVVSISDGLGNIMPSRKKSMNKIDGIPATIMALSLAMRDPGESRSVYEERGPEVF